MNKQRRWPRPAARPEERPWRSRCTKAGRLARAKRPSCLSWTQQSVGTPSVPSPSARTVATASSPTGKALHPIRHYRRCMRSSQLKSAAGTVRKA
eukprot:scaffold492_cov257-Pinguiococcus_pyrenoidosus.AAC.40